VNLSAILDRLSRMQRAQRIAIYGVLLVLLAVGFWALAYLPQSSTLGELKKQQQQLMTQKAQVEVTIQNRKQFEIELEQLNQDLVQALKELPDDREIPGLLKGISTLGKKVGLEVRKFTPLPENEREYVAEVPVELEVRGSYHEVAMFFDRLSKMNRIVYVQDIEMGASQERGGKVYLTVEGKAVTFRFLTDAERAKKQKAGGKGGKRRRGRK
jgi:type IV pilus assembly protein PilO